MCKEKKPKEKSIVENLVLLLYEQMVRFFFSFCVVFIIFQRSSVQVFQLYTIGNCIKSHVASFIIAYNHLVLISCLSLLRTNHLYELNVV